MYSLVSFSAFSLQALESHGASNERHQVVGIDIVELIILSKDDVISRCSSV